MLKSAKSPYGYKKLLVYQRAEELQSSCSALTHLFPRHKTLLALADQMDRSARSVKQNIVEGWKRNSTKEYYEFLGFSIGANAELEEDCADIWKGVYPELMGVRGVMGEMGVIERVGKREEARENGSSQSHSTLSTHSTPSSRASNSHTPSHSTISSRFTPSSRYSQPSHFSPSTPSSLLDIEKFPFYPLDPNLPPVVQLKLRAKEINFLLAKLQKSLEDKMTSEHTLSGADRFKKSQIKRHSDDEWYKKILTKQGLERLENGKIVKKDNIG